METKTMEAIKKKQEGYNCAQAVFCTYCEEFGVSQEQGYQITEALGTGISGMQEVCGAFSALSLLVGMKESDGVLASKATRPKTYQLTQAAAKLFQEQCQHLLCREIIQNVDETGKRRVPCEDCVKAAAQIAEELLLSDCA